jgi:hypothetical protein
MSALRGEGVHAMSFAGSEILPTANPAGTSMWLEESNQYGETPTNWVSHPSGIGYRRNSPGITTSGSGSGSGSSSSTGAPIPGNPVTMDTGMSDGGDQDEINRLNNFITGGNENPTSIQPGPIGRAEQIAMPTTPTASPAAVGFGETTGRDVIGDIMNQQGGGTWTPYGNPLYHPSSASPNSHPSSSERSGATGRGYGNKGYGSPPVDPAPPAASPPPPPPPPDDGDAADTDGAAEALESCAEAQQAADPDEGRPYKVNSSAKPSQEDIDMVRDTLAQLVDNSPKFRKLLEARQDGSFGYRFNYVVSNIGYTENLKQYSHGLAGLSTKTTAADRARGFYANITIYAQHPEFQLLPPNLKKRFLMDVIIHETIHAYLSYNKPRFVDDDPNRTGQGGDPNTATLLKWMNKLYPLEDIPNMQQRKALAKFRERYGNLDIGEKSQQFIVDVFAEVDAAKKTP